MRSYEQVLRATVLPELGHLKLSTLTRNVLQDLIDKLVAEGRSASTVRNTILPLRAIYRRSLSRSEVLITRRLVWHYRPCASDASGSRARARRSR